MKHLKENWFIGCGTNYKLLKNFLANFMKCKGSLNLKLKCTMCCLVINPLDDFLKVVIYMCTVNIDACFFWC